MTTDITALLEAMRERYETLGIEVICDETNNTPEDIENNVLNVSLKLPRTVQFINIDAIVGN